MAKVAGGADAQPLVEDLVDRFARLSAMANVQKQYLQGIIDSYQARTHTKMTIAAERLALIAAVPLPITVLSSVLGKNLIVNDSTRPIPLSVALGIMTVMSALLLAWARRKGWW